MEQAGVELVGQQRERRRRAHAAHYAERLADAPVDLPVEADYARHVYQVYVIRANNRDEIREALGTLGYPAKAG